MSLPIAVRCKRSASPHVDEVAAKRSREDSVTTFCKTVTQAFEELREDDTMEHMPRELQALITDYATAPSAVQIASMSRAWSGVTEVYLCALRELFQIYAKGGTLMSAVDFIAYANTCGNFHKLMPTSPTIQRLFGEYGVWACTSFELYYTELSLRDGGRGLRRNIAQQARILCEYK